MSLYHGFVDPLHTYILQEEENLARLGTVMHRQQIEVQYQPTAFDLARAWFIFVDEEGLPRTREAFLSDYGVSLQTWFKCALLAFVLTEGSPALNLSKIDIPEAFAISRDDFRRYLNLSSLSPTEIGRRYRAIRTKFTHKFHGLIRTIFLATPLIHLEHDWYLAPAAELLMRHASEGCYELARQCSEYFTEELGGRFQGYVGRCLEEWPRTILLDEHTIKQRATRQNCDFVIELPDCVALVECKATTLRCDILTDAVLANQNMIRKIQEGILQIFDTAFDIQNGAFKCCALDEGKPLLGFVVVFGDIPYPNSPWFREKVIDPRVAVKLTEKKIGPDLLRHDPITLTTAALELLTTALNAGESLLDLCASKQEQAFLSVGDWTTFLGHVLEGRIQSSIPNFVREFSDRYFQSVGVDLPDVQH